MVDPPATSGPSPAGTGDSVKQLVDDARSSLERSLSDLMDQVERDELAVGQASAGEQLETMISSRLGDLQAELRREEAEAGDALRADLELRISAILDEQRRRLRTEAEEHYRELAGQVERRLLDMEERVRLAELHLRNAIETIDRGSRVEERMLAATAAEEQAAGRIADAERRIADLIDESPD